MSNSEIETNRQQFKSWSRLFIGLFVAIAVVEIAAGVILLVAKRKGDSDTTFDRNAQDKSHTTRVSSRVDGQVSRVLVDDKSRVKQGDLLVELDREPYELQVSLKQAVAAEAEADVVAARAQANGMIAQVRANRYKLQQAIEDVNAQISNLRADVAALNSKQASLELARTNLKRGEELAPSGVISKDELSKRQRAVQIEAAAVEQALQVVNASRASMGLSGQPAASASLDETPADLDQKDSSVRQALLEFLHPLALLGYTPPSWKATPNEVIEDFYKQDPDADLDRIYAKILDRAPAVKQADTKLLKARRDLELAELDLRYCRITSAVDGVVAHCNANPGNHVEVGEILLEIRPLTPAD